MRLKTEEPKTTSIRVLVALNYSISLDSFLDPIDQINPANIAIVAFKWLIENEIKLDPSHLEFMSLAYTIATRYDLSISSSPSRFSSRSIFIKKYFSFVEILTSKHLKYLAEFSKTDPWLVLLSVSKVKKILLDSNEDYYHTYIVFKNAYESNNSHHIPAIINTIANPYCISKLFVTTITYGDAFLLRQIELTTWLSSVDLNNDIIKITILKMLNANLFSARTIPCHE
ncbi:hypothetical protein KIH39_22885 [Telmatocola sphagniphila]|uniref:Uncharacterized protein n=1 Tax=Telmatocola sphagniphila TaxID=1123043 RepID=A0A8E6EUP3_9BACT|nr:hypothetical protein [Telmatocola sphagniphila]QVL31660.1 hypothetical protein KIH39_22885 [Telmatocola sphagniphila]